MNAHATPTVRLNVETTTRRTKQKGVGNHCFAAKFLFKTLPERLMKRSLATRSVDGIGHAKTQPMKNLYSDLHPDREVLGGAIMRAEERSQKIRIVFKDDLSAHGAEILIKHRRAFAKISMPELKNHNKLDCLSTVRATS